MSRWPQSTLGDRIWPKVRKSDGCWIWTGGMGKGGGVATLPGGTTTSARRVVWHLARGPIPTGMALWLDCETPACVRPEHMRLVTDSHGMTLADRFWAKVAKSEGCWEWQAGRNKRGYGAFHPRHGVSILAHRMVWELSFGPIPTGSFVCHRCDNPPCVRPDHLFLGSNADNMQDMTAKGRDWASTGDAEVIRQRMIASRPRGAAHPMARLTEDQVNRIRALAMAGQSQRSIAREFAVSQSLVGMIVRHQRWASI